MSRKLNSPLKKMATALHKMISRPISLKKDIYIVTKFLLDIIFKGSKWW